MNKELLNVYNLYLNAIQPQKEEEAEEIEQFDFEPEYSPSFSLEELYKKFPPLEEDEIEEEELKVIPGQVYEYLYDPEILPLFYVVLSEDSDGFVVSLMTPYWELSNENSLLCDFPLMGRKVSAILPIIQKISKEIIEKSFLEGELDPKDLEILQKFYLKKEGELPPNRRGFTSFSPDSYRAKFLEIERERSAIISQSLEQFKAVEPTEEIQTTPRPTDSPSPTELEQAEPIFSPPEEPFQPAREIGEPLPDESFERAIKSPTLIVIPQSFEFPSPKTVAVAAKLKDMARDYEKILFIDRKNNKIFLDIYEPKNRDVSIYYRDEKLADASLRDKPFVKVTLEMDKFSEKLRYIDAEELISQFKIKPQHQTDGDSDIRVFEIYRQMYLNSSGEDRARAHHILKIALGELKSSQEEFQPELYGQLYEMLEHPKFCNCIKYDIIEFFQKNRSASAIEEFIELFHSEELAEKLIENRDIIRVKFPIVRADSGEGVLATACVIPLRERANRLHLPTSDSSVEKALENIRQFQVKGNREKKEFFVYFDQDFEGDSFMLAVWSALNLNPRELKRYAFTGSITKNGYIERADFIDEKQKIAENAGRKLISNRLFSKVKQLEELLNKKTEIPLLILVQKDPDSSLRQFKSSLISELNLDSEYFEKVKELFDISDEDFVIYRDSELGKDPREWRELIDKFESRVREINQKRGGEVVFNFSTTIVALALGLGAKFGAKHPVRIFHFTQGGYKIVVDLSKNTRQIKEKVKSEFEYIKCREEGERDSETLAIAVWLASHTPYKDVETFVRERYPHSKILKIESKRNQGALNPENMEEWINTARELYSVIDNHKAPRNLMFISAPVALAFALGISLGHFVNIDVFNYARDQIKGRDKYYKVFNLTELVSNT